MISDWTRVTLTFPVGTRIAVPPTHQILDDGRLQATFTRDELRLALELAGGCVECYGLPPCESCTKRPIPEQQELFSIHA
jgi:hypothetical protein